MRNHWEFYIDTGGTFTDCLARCGELENREKVLSRGSLTGKVVKQLSSREVKLDIEADWPNKFPNGFRIFFESIKNKSLRVESWNLSTKTLRFSEEIKKASIVGQTIELFSGWEAPILGMRLILARRNQVESECKIRMRLATTRCTNALLENSGKPPALFLTKGFPDLLNIGDQRRLGLFDLIPRKIKSFAGPCVEVEERTDRTGKVIKKPKTSEWLITAKKLTKQGHQVAVVSFLNSYLNDENEKIVLQELKNAGFSKVINSASIHPFIKWLTRSESSVLEGYLSPILNEYLNNITSEIGDKGELLIMNSAGGLFTQNYYRAVDSLLSGPAAGLVGASAVARRAGMDKFINFDMGGTSTDVSRFSGGYSYQRTQQVGDARLASVSMEIETVAAGGGSICKVKRGKLSVGPESAGAFPGPACYGFGGPLCLTDINLILGRLDPSRFPTPISKDAALFKLEELAKSSGYSEKKLLDGFITLANEAMSRAIRKISVEQGYDPSEHGLVSFGGAGGQHICGIAERLGIRKILSPCDSGLLSAYGLSMSRVERVVESPIHKTLSKTDFQKFENKLAQKGFDLLAGFDGQTEITRKTAFVRMEGQESGLEIDYQNASEILSIYEIKFSEIFGYLPDMRKIEVFGLRFVFSLPSTDLGKENFEKSTEHNINKQVGHAQIINRDDMKVGDLVEGPCLISDNFGAVWVDSRWSATKGSLGSILLEQSSFDLLPMKNKFIEGELFASRFFCLVEEMGAQLRRTAISVNVRERLDFSCALLDSKGYLIANAPHIPVHLGALGVCVRESIKLFPELKIGDVIITNHPAFGGSHLPDITVIAPIFSDDNIIIGFLANRAHHAEIGGISPGSMPACSTSLKQEGVVISPQYLFREGESCMDVIKQLLIDSEFPSRQVKSNLADLSAQVASLRQGLKEMKILELDYSVKVLVTQMNNLKKDASKYCMEALKELSSKEVSSVQFLDDGDELHLKLQINKGNALFDFSGTSAFRKDNLNATEAITQSAVCYCLRLLIKKETPLNEGILKPVRLIIPKGSILSPVFELDANKCPGVAGGNVEISQKLVDLILSAFNCAACSQGTMNNITFGNNSYSHYETIGGGSGATIDHHGTSAVQVHMTNTAITDPEVLESRFPVRLIGFKIRRDSGGKGIFKGGDGIEREYIFEEKSTLNLLNQNRKKGASGLNGGERGKPGEEFIIRNNGKHEQVHSGHSLSMLPGDRLLLRTPGGGGAGQ